MEGQTKTATQNGAEATVQQVPIESDLDWKDQGSCRGLGQEASRIFFPERGHSLEPARGICAGCVVKSECLEFALENHALGVWGGTSERERRQIRKSIRLAKKAIKETVSEPVETYA